MPRHDTARPRGSAPSGSSGISGPATGRVRWRARVVGATAAARSMPGVYERTFETASGRSSVGVSPAWPSTAPGPPGPARAGPSAPAWPPRRGRRHRRHRRSTRGARRWPAPPRPLEVLERRRRHARLPVLVEVAHDVGQPLRRGALGQVDGDDVGVDVHPGGLPGGEQAPGQLGGRTGTEGVGRRAEVLVAHPGQRPVQLEPHDPRRRARLLRDRDHLTHAQSVPRDHRLRYVLTESIPECGAAGRARTIGRRSHSDRWTRRGPTQWLVTA